MRFGTIVPATTVPGVPVTETMARTTAAGGAIANEQGLTLRTGTGNTVIGDPGRMRERGWHG